MREGWEVKELNDFCDIEYGTRVVRKRDGGTIYPVYGGGGATFFMDTTNRKDCLVVARFAMSEKCTRFVSGEFFLNDSGLTVVPKNKEEMLQEFLNMQFLYLNDYIYSLARGTAQKNLNVPEFRKIKIVIPPLPEQKQIVKTLDLAFGQIDQAKANLEQNLANAKELFASKLNEVFSQRGEGWEEKRLGDIASVEYGFTAKSTTEGTLRYVRITDIDKQGNLILNEKKYIEDTDEARQFQLKNNDIVMARTGATFAKVLLYKDYEPSVFASYLIRINFTENISNELYWYFSKSQFYWSQANALSSGSAQPHFNGKALKEVLFSYPKSEVKQKELIFEFKNLLDEIQTLQTHYQQNLNNLEELKKSILEKAFKGELVGVSYPDLLIML